MPLPKRVVEPIHISRGTVPDSNEISLPSELETVTNGTLANTIRQLSSLSRHAEDLFSELTREAHTLASRANSLQARLDKLAIKTTQLDSTVEEVSLQEIHMRKAYKSATVFDQQVVSRDTMPTAMLETYNQCDKPPPLYKLNPYREDDKDGMKFYTDPDYFFQLWRQEMLKDTERMMHDKGKKPHKPRSADSSGGRHKKRVRPPHNTRERQRQNAVKHGEYIMANAETIYASSSIHPNYEYEDDSAISSLSTDQRPSRPNSIEIKRNYSQHVVDGNKGIIYSPTSNQRYSPTNIYYRGNYAASMGYDENAIYQQQMLHQSQQQIMSPSVTNGHIVTGMMSPNGTFNNDMLSPSGTPTRGSKVRPSQPPPAPPSATNSSSSTPSVNTPTRGRSMSAGRETLPPPPPPPVETMAVMPPVDLPPPPPAMSQSPPSTHIPPPPPPPPPLPHSTAIVNGPSAVIANGDIGKSPIKPMMSTSPPNRMASPKQLENNCISGAGSNVSKLKCNGPQSDPRSDLLKAIRDGITLRKVEKIEQKDNDRVNTYDVASILARRMAVQISDSESDSDDSEYDSEGWAEQDSTVHS